MRILEVFMNRNAILSILASLDTSKLFGFSVKGTDITNDEEFTCLAAKEFTAPCTYYINTKNRTRFVSVDSDKGRAARLNRT